MRCSALAVIAMSLWIFAAVYAQDTLWTRIYDVYNSESGKSIVQTDDGGFIVAGFSGWEDRYCHIYVVKIEADGDSTWTRVYNFNDLNYAYANDICHTSDSCYVLAGVSDWAMFAMKINILGDTIWTRVYDGFPANSIQETGDRGFIIAGQLGGDFYIVKTDSLGIALWDRRYGGILGDVAYSVQTTSDAGYIVVGGTYSFGAGDVDAYAVKIDADGDTLWTKTYGGPDSDCAWSVEQTDDGGYILAGETNSFGSGEFDCYLIKTDSSGDTLWTRTYGGAEDDFAYSVQQTTDGGFAVTGGTRSFNLLDIYLIRTDATGDTIWTQTYNGNYQGCQGRSIKLVNEGGYIITGTINPGPWQDLYVVRIAENSVSIGDNVNRNRPDKYSLSQNNPNPFNVSTVIGYYLPYQSQVTIDIFDILGRRVGTIQDGIQSASNYKVMWNARDLPSGVYFYKIQAGDYSETRKMVLLK